ncbi:MAG: hypothetical protein JO041_10085 [Acidobacteria bacterium]|nr:hypothetical protein [Acidobacteriota bacterium]
MDNDHVDRRRIMQRAGMLLGAGGALAALSLPAGALRADEEDELAGLWHSIVSTKDNSVPAFAAFELFSGGIWIGSGSTDLSPAALSSPLWAIYKRIGRRTFHGGGRFWTYEPNGTPNGFAAVEQITTVDEQGRRYQGEGTIQFFDPSGAPLAPASPVVDDGQRIVVP